MIGYLEKHPDRRLVVDARPMETIPGTPLRTDKSEMKHLYPDAIEEIDPAFPEPRGRPLETSVWFDANNAHDMKTRRSIEGIMIYVGRALIKAKSQRQGTIAASTYGSEIHSGRTASEWALDVRYLARSFGLNILDPTLCFGDNRGSLVNVTDPNSPLRQRSYGISYHTARECEAADVTIRRHVISEENKSDGQTKALNRTAHNKLYKSGGPVFCENGTVLPRDI